MAGASASVYLCSYRGCGRVVTFDDDEILQWLVARREDNPALLVIRCPQHITERTLRYAGRRRTKAMYKWARDNRLKDERRRTKKVLPPGAAIQLSPELNAHAIMNQGVNHKFRKYRIVHKKERKKRKK